MENKLVKDVVKITKRIVGDPIKIGDRTMTPTMEFTVYSKQFTSKEAEIAPVIVGVIVKPISLLVTEANTEWTIMIQE